MNHLLRLSTAGLLLLVSMPVAAAGPLRMADALARALTESPKLETYSYSIRAAEAERLQAAAKSGTAIATGKLCRYR